MNRLLKVSISLNLALAGGMMWIWLERHPVSQAVPKTLPPTNAGAAIAPPVTSGAALEPFRWSQLEATDYHIYVKNLRGIGCPEPTLRAIVTADVHAACQVQARELEGKISALGAVSWTNQISADDTKAALDSELQQIPAEEAAMINDLLGYQPVPAKVANKRQPKPDRPIALPLAMQEIDPTVMNLNDGQKQVIAEIRQNFLEQVGGANQDPTDPAYLERWQRAQPAADAMMRGMLGTSFYQFYQLAASGNNQGPETNP